MTKRSQKLVSALVGCTLTLGTMAAAAAEQEYNLDDYVVTANRIPVKKADTAASVTVITRADIEKGGYTRVLEILDKANVSILDCGSAGYFDSAVFINGDDRVLIMIDGRKINKENDVGGGKTKFNLNFLPSVKNIERIEIVRGPASSLYGSDAAGGVINIITRKASKQETSYLVQGGSWGIFNQTLTTEGRENGFGYFITAERKRQDYFEYKDPKTGTVKHMPNSKVEQNAVSVKLDKDLSEGRSLTLYWNYMNSNIGYFLTPPGYKWHFPTAYEINQSNDVDLTYRWKNKTGTDGFFKVYHSADLRDDYHYYENTPYEVDKYSMTSRTNGMEWQNNWKITDNYDVVGGASWRKVTMDIPCTGIYNKEMTDKAMFFENHWRLSDDWNLNAGMRYDQYNSFGSKNTARLAVNHKINKDTNVFASWGQFFRAPIIQELYSLSVPQGNPNLRPETGDTVTLGMNTKLNDKTKIQTSVFSSRIDDAIVRYSDGFLQTYKNVSKQKRHGFDIHLNHQLSPAWNVSAGYAYVQVREKGQGADSYRNYPTNNQPNGYRLNLEYSQDKWNGQIALRGATGRSLAAFTSSSYWVVDVAADYKVSSDLHAYFKGYNLTNRAYELNGLEGYAGSFPMAARRFTFGLEQRI